MEIMAQAAYEALDKKVAKIVGATRWVAYRRISRIFS